MGSLYHEKNAARVQLEAIHSVGRAERASLRVNDPRVSLEHASIRWEGDRWTLRDLGSLNNTFLDGAALNAGEVRNLRVGSRIAFGAYDSVWLFESPEPPRLMAVPLAGGEARLEEDGLLALPSTDEPLVTVYRNASGAWEIDPAQGGLSEVVDAAIIEVQGERFRLCVPRPPERTVPVQGLQGAHAADLSITFHVSSDLDDIELSVRRGTTECRLPARAHFEILRVLARARREDVAAQLPDPNCGWLHVDELANRVKLDVEHVNVQIFRIRRQFSTLGLVDPAHIIERRTRGRLLRFGASSSKEVPL